VDGLLKNGQSQQPPTGEIEDLRQMINDACSNVDVLTNSFREEREAILETFLREIDTQIRAELATQISSTCAEFRSELQNEIITRIGAAERDAIASVKESFGAGVQTALGELHNQFKKLQAAQLEVGNLTPRLMNIEHELRGTTRLVTSLAKKALDDHENKFGGPGASVSASSGADSTPAISGFASVTKKGLVSGDFGDTIFDDPTPSGLSTAAASSDISTMRGHKMRPQYGHEGIEESPMCYGEQFPDEDELTQTRLLQETDLSQSTHSNVDPPPIPEGLFANLQGLASSIDKTIGMWAPPGRSAFTSADSLHSCLDRSIRSLQLRRTMSPVRSPPSAETVHRFDRATVGSPTTASRQLAAPGSPPMPARNSPPMPQRNTSPRLRHGMEGTLRIDGLPQRAPVPVDCSQKMYVSPRSSIDLSASQKSAPGTPQQATRAMPATGNHMPAHVQRQLSGDAVAPISPQHVHRQISAPVSIARLEATSLSAGSFEAPPTQPVRVAAAQIAASPGGLSTSYRTVQLPASIHQGVSGASPLSPRTISRTC